MDVRRSETGAPILLSSGVIHRLIGLCASTLPDFYDHFTGLFSFEGPKDAEAEGERTIHLSVSSDLKVSAEVPSILVAGSRPALAFYERRWTEFQGPTLERARALLGLAETLWATPTGM